MGSDGDCNGVKLAILGGGAIFPIPPGGGGSGPAAPFLTPLAFDVPSSFLGIFICIVCPSLKARFSFGPLQQVLHLNYWSNHLPWQSQYLFLSL